MLSWPMIAFGWVTNMLQRGMASWKRMLDVLDAPPAISDAHVTDAGRSAPLTGGNRIPGPVFTYPERTIRSSITCSLRIEAGQTVALVGATGSGKSTLVSLLPRLYEPPPGTVFLDGVDVRDFPLAALRGAIGIVPQEPFLFSDTIAENIAFGVLLAQGHRPGPTRVAASGSSAASARRRKLRQSAANDMPKEAITSDWDRVSGSGQRRRHWWQRGARAPDA